MSVAQGADAEGLGRLNCAQPPLSRYVTSPPTPLTIVSTTGRTGMAASWCSIASSRRPKTATGMKGRAASCTKTASSSLKSARSARPAATESCLRDATRDHAHRAPPPRSSAATKSSIASAGAVTTMRSVTEARYDAAHRTRGTPSIGTSALGRSRPNREPLPAAVMTAARVTRREPCPDGTRRRSRHTSPRERVRSRGSGAPWTACASRPR